MTAGYIFTGTDTGAGKTVVAVATMLAAVQGGHQAALMAPTEVLADQHATGVRALLDGVSVADPDNLFGDRPLRVELLTNRVTGSDRKDVLAGLADGTVDISDQVIDAIAADREAEVLRRHVLELVRLVDDGVAAARDDLAEVALPEGGVAAASGWWASSRGCGTPPAPSGWR